MRWWPLAGIYCAMLIATIGCGSNPEPKPEAKLEPTRLEITLSATEDSNPSANGSPSPIVARLFALRGQSAFATADFFALWDTEQAALARDLLWRDELVLRPGQTTTLNSIVDPDARVLGVAAAYQDIHHATWRAMAPLIEGRINAFKMELASRAVSLQARPEENEPEKRTTTDKKKEQK